MKLLDEQAKKRKVLENARTVGPILKSAAVEEPVHDPQTMQQGFLLPHEKMALRENTNKKQKITEMWRMWWG